MYYRLDVTFEKQTTIIAIGIKSGITQMPYPPIKQIKKKGDVEKIGYFFKDLKTTVKHMKQYARTKEQHPNFMYNFLAWDDVDRELDKLSENHPELII